MSSSKLLRMSLFVMTFLILSTAILIAYTRTQKKQKDSVRTYEAAKVTAAPQVVSRVKDLEISGVTLIDEGTPQAALAIDVINHRDEAVMALDFLAGGAGTTSGLGVDGLLQEDNPLVIVPPHSLKTFNWSLGEILEGGTIRLAAAIFADGREEGEKRSLKGIKNSRAHYQKKQRAEKANKGGQQ
jgi:hypothetical protein